jgi:hypothetical protein
MDRAVHTASATEPRIRGIRDEIDVLGGDIADDELDRSTVDGQAEHRRLGWRLRLSAHRETRVARSTFRQPSRWP